MKIPREILREIAECRGAERNMMIKQTAKTYKVAVGTVYRALQKFENRRKEIRLRNEEERIVKKIMGLKFASRGKKHQRISTEMAINEAIKRGIIPDRKYSRARIDEVARKLGLDEKHLRMARPCVRLTTPGPNTWVQVDFTVAQHFYMKNMRVHFRDIFSKQEPKKKIILGSHVDMYSGCKFWYAYEALGENTLLATDFLYRAFSKKDATFPTHGLPWNVYCDQGSPFKSRYFKSLLKRLGTKLYLHGPGNPRATGMVEKSFQQTQRLEALLKTRVNERDWPTIDDFNQWLFEFAVDENNKKRKGSRKSKFEKWLEIHPEDLRNCPPREIFMNLTAVGEVTRRVHSELCIYYGGKAYWVGISDLCGETVDVFTNVDGKIWIQHPFVGFVGPLKEGVKTNVMGEDFERPELTYWEKNLKDAIEIVKEEGIEKPGKYYSRETEKIHGIPQGTEDIKQNRLSKEALSILDAKMKISEEVGISLGDLPQSTREIIDKILESHADAYGMVQGEIIEKVCMKMKEVLRCSE